MKICVSSKGDNLDAEVDPRFGRCKYFLIIDPDSWDFESVDNESVMASGGAGIQAAQNVADKGCSIAITGNMGPNAFRTLEAAGIDVYTGASGTVKDAVESFKKGELKKSENPTVGGHHGMGRMSGGR